MRKMEREIDRRREVEGNRERDETINSTTLNIHFKRVHHFHIYKICSLAVYISLARTIM